MNLEFYRGKRVVVTGHTGFKGSWLCRMLVGAGAVVTGYSLQPPTTPNLCSLAGLEGKMTSVIGDIRNFAAMHAAFDAAQPEIVLHLAAQPIVRDSYKDPRYTYETNVMGASFRRTEQILALTGCDRLTIAPNLLKELQEKVSPVVRKLIPPSQTFPRPAPMSEAEFRWEHNQDAMAVEKLSEGIRLFAVDQRKLEDLLAAKL